MINPEDVSCGSIRRGLLPIEGTFIKACKGQEVMFALPGSLSPTLGIEESDKVHVGRLGLENGTIIYAIEEEGSEYVFSAWREKVDKHFITSHRVPKNELDLSEFWAHVNISLIGDPD
jgi:hypothetical protein